MSWYKLAQYNNIIFFKFLDFDNSKSKRELPYQGIHAWAAETNKLNHILMVARKNMSDINIVNISPTDHIYAIRYSDADFYVMMPSYEEWLEKYGPYDNLSEQEQREYYEEQLKEELPKLEPFDPNKHLIRTVTIGYDPPWEEGYEDIANPYQVLIIRENNELV